jgi:hypothetical protein
MPYVLVILAIAAVIVWVLVAHYHWHLLKHWPFLKR